jgi:hypothetical protein
VAERIARGENVLGRRDEDEEAAAALAAETFFEHPEDVEPELGEGDAEATNKE